MVRKYKTLVDSPLFWGKSTLALGVKVQIYLSKIYFESYQQFWYSTQLQGIPYKQNQSRNAFSIQMNQAIYYSPELLLTF